MNMHWNKTATLLAALCFSTATVAFAQSGSSRTVELTETDLFSLPDWQHQIVSLDGFSLGVTRGQAVEVGKAKGLVLRNAAMGKVGESRVPCTQQECDVGQLGGPWIGIDLFFERDRVSKIKNSVPVDADPEIKKVNVARRFKGLTRQFFNHYSDDLRIKILGSVEPKTTQPKLSTEAESAYTYFEYDYPQAGLAVHFTTGRDYPNPFDLEVEFLSAK